MNPKLDIAAKMGAYLALMDADTYEALLGYVAPRFSKAQFVDVPIAMMPEVRAAFKGCPIRPVFSVDGDTFSIYTKEKNGK